MDNVRVLIRFNVKNGVEKGGFLISNVAYCNRSEVYNVNLQQLKP